MTETHWKLRDYLKRNNLSAYQLAKALPASRQPTIYRLASENPPSSVSLDVLNRVIHGLRELTGEDVTPNDLLEVMPTDVALTDEDTGEGSAVDLAALLANAAKHAKVRAGADGKVEGSAIPAKITGKGPSVVEIIRAGRR